MPSTTPPHWPQIITADPTSSAPLAVARPRGAIRLRGPDAAKFLQGQTTCDLLALAEQPDGQTLGGAQCTPKGRMIFDFYAFFTTADGHRDLILIIAPDLVAIAITGLKKYAVFFKVEITDVSGDWCQLLLFGDTPQALPAAAAVANLAEKISALSLPCSAAAQLTLPDWRLGEDAEAAQRLLAAGIAEVTAATSELFIPQMLNFDYRGYISFKKGCYTGQEIVARAHYRGAVKRRLALLQSPAELPATAKPGSELRDSDGRAIGTVAAVAGTALLAAVTEAALAASQFAIDEQPLSATVSALAAAAD